MSKKNIRMHKHKFYANPKKGGGGNKVGGVGEKVYKETPNIFILKITTVSPMELIMEKSLSNREDIQTSSGLPFILRIK